MHYFDAAHEPKRGGSTGRPEFNPDNEPAFYALCGANMNTTGNGPERCPKCAAKVAALNLPDQQSDMNGFDPDLADEVRNYTDEVFAEPEAAGFDPRYDTP